MKLSLFTDLGLRVLMRLAGEPDRLVSTPELADELRVSRNHLTKVVARLSQAGHIITRRGNHGGISLARPAEDIRIGDLVRDLEEGVSIVDCFRPDGGTCTLKDTCALPSRLTAAKRCFIEALNQSSLADVAYRPGRPPADQS